MSKTKQRFLYAAYVISVTLFFLYILFPSEVAKKYMVSGLNRINPDFDIMIGNVEPDFPPGIKLYNVSAYHNGDSVFDAEKIVLSPAILSFFAGKLSLYIDGAVYAGLIEAKVDFSWEKFLPEKVYVRLNDIQIGEIIILKNLIPHDLEGVLNGSITYDAGEEKNISVTSDISLAEFEIEFLSPYYGLEALSFKNIEADLELNRKQLKVDRFTNTGGDADGSLSGSVLIRDVIGRSVLNLKGSVRPNSVFIEKLEKINPVVKVFLKKSSGNNDIPVHIQGTLERPRFF
ncbi:MAG: type II secretion system protein GspN [Deltaproteobacteria bacterium]|nr:type II secretion system protein GspN [Deltaproteobacteria bacterium]